MPLVSVIVPNYNHAKYLEQRIESILNQTFNDFELLILDDASTDESVKVINRYKVNENVRCYLNEENSGSPFKQWNKGVNLAKGELIWIAESDDYANEKYLEEMVPLILANNEVGIAFCKSFKIDENNNLLGAWEDWVFSGKEPLWEKDFIEDGVTACKRFLREGNYLPNASSIVFRKKYFEMAGGAEETMRRAGDMMTYAKILLNSKLAFKSKTLNFYRSHKGSVRSKSKFAGLRFEEISRVYFYLLQQLKLDQSEKKSALSKITEMWANDCFAINGGRIRLNVTVKTFLAGQKCHWLFIAGAFVRLCRRPLIKVLKYLKRRCLAKSETFVPVKEISNKNKYHWFGYYDKKQFSTDGRIALGMEVDFENRAPLPTDKIKIGTINLEKDNSWTEIGTSYAWCWQQGCMLQWVPCMEKKIIWNDRKENEFYSKMYDLKTNKTRDLKYPIYSLHPNEAIALTLNFARLNDMRPGYGYSGGVDRNFNNVAPDECGIYLFDIEKQQQNLVVSLKTIASLNQDSLYTGKAKHWFNHLLFNPDGTRFVFLHRWREPGEQVFGTRMITANIDGSDVFVLDKYNRVSHFCWKDSNHLLSWAWRPDNGSGFYLYEDKTDTVEIIGKNIMVKNGHCTYLDNTNWIINDTYPDDIRRQEVYLYNCKERKKYVLAKLFSPLKYEGQFRCDAHPRINNTMGTIVIDGTFKGHGRQQYIIDINNIVKTKKRCQ